jgi:hypothetical protein
MLLHQLMAETFGNGLLDMRWEDAPLGPDAIRLVLSLRSNAAQPSAPAPEGETRWHARHDIIQWLEDLSTPKSYVKPKREHHIPARPTATVSLPSST